MLSRSQIECLDERSEFAARGVVGVWARSRGVLSCGFGG